MGHCPSEGVKKKYISVDEASILLKERYQLNYDIENWIRNDFDIIHKNIFMDSPFLVLTIRDGEEVIAYE